MRRDPDSSSLSQILKRLYSLVLLLYELEDRVDRSTHTAIFGGLAILTQLSLSLSCTHVLYYNTRRAQSYDLFARLCVCLYGLLYIEFDGASRESLMNSQRLYRIDTRVSVCVSRKSIERVFPAVDVSQAF